MARIHSFEPKDVTEKGTIRLSVFAINHHVSAGNHFLLLRIGHYHPAERSSRHQGQNPCGSEAACANGNADGRNTKPVKQGENQIDAADQRQHWHYDPDWSVLNRDPAQNAGPANSRTPKTVAKVKPQSKLATYRCARPIA